MMKNILITFALLALCSCGQGGGSSNADEGGSVTNPDESRMSDLLVAPDFDFIGGESLRITVVDSGSAYQRRYLNICSDFRAVDGGYRVSYDSCLIRTSINAPHTDFELGISSSQQELIAQLWYLQDGADPVSHRWSRSVHGEQWTIEVF